MDSKSELSEMYVSQINKDISDLRKLLNDMDFKIDRLASIIRIFYNVDSMEDILKRGENHIKNINLNIENMEQLMTVLKTNEEKGIPIDESGVYYDKNNIKDYNDFYKYLNEEIEGNKNLIEVTDKDLEKIREYITKYGDSI